MLAQHFERYSGRPVTVIGLAVSNLPLIDILLKAGAVVTGRDKKCRADLGPEADRLEAAGVKLILGDAYLQDLPPDTIFCTPGINPNREELARAARSGAAITSEMDAFMHLCPCPVIAVTGSDGKTTTTTIISEMLTAAGKSVWLGGNIGRPLLPLVDEMTADDIAVVELSSFQLMTVSRPPHIAVITNITPNHLDVHTDMDEYVAAKAKIFAGQQPGDLVVLNAGSEITAAMAGDAPAGVRMFSAKAPLQDGVWLENGMIYSGGRAVFATRDIKLPGAHNAENYMAAIAALDGWVPYDAMRQVAQSFGGVEHRLELVRTLNGVRYYNDSMSSSPTRTSAGLKCFEQKVILIAGGYDKKIPFDSLGADICAGVKTLILCGATAGQIEAAVLAAPGEKPQIITTQTLDDAVAEAAKAAASGDTVLFSPACASFDQFKNFDERGKYFKLLANNLI